MSHPNDPPPQPAPKHVAPYLILLILLGIATPFAINIYRTKALASNEQAVVAMLRQIAKAQDAHFASHKEYAQSLADLGGEFAELPELDEVRGGTVEPAKVEDPNVQSGTRSVRRKGGNAAWHGYRFRMLKGTSGTSGSQSFIDENNRMTKGFALMAVPEKYGFTGRDTFLMNGSEMYAKDFDVYTDRVTQPMFHYNLPEGAQKVP